MAPNLIENYVANNTDFKSTVGWRVGYTGIKGSDDDVLPNYKCNSGKKMGVIMSALL